MTRNAAPYVSAQAMTISKRKRGEAQMLGWETRASQGIAIELELRAEVERLRAEIERLTRELDLERPGAEAMTREPCDDLKKLVRGLRESARTFEQHTTYVIPAMDGFIKRHIKDIRRAADKLAALEPKS